MFLNKFKANKFLYPNDLLMTHKEFKLILIICLSSGLMLYLPKLTNYTFGIIVVALMFDIND